MFATVGVEHTHTHTHSLNHMGDTRDTPIQTNVILIAYLDNHP